MKTLADAVCPAPVTGYNHVTLGHGGGGRLTAQLIDEVFAPAFYDADAVLEDQAVVRLGGRLAVTTDAYVVRPLFFPGGDIGRLAVYGTINDLAVGGAVPRAITAAFVLEEGLPLDDLRRIVASMRSACAECDVRLVTGDTKVVERGRCDGIYVTTTGIGEMADGIALSAASARPGDRVLVSGTLGDHGLTILSAREGLAFDSALRSDTAPLTGLTTAILAAAPGVRCMRDATRGGASASLHEIARASRVGIVLDGDVPVRPEVRGACEIFGLDPLYVANEGKLVAVVPADQADAALAALRTHPLGADADVIGEIVAAHPGVVAQRLAFGGTRVVPQLSGEQLPRIC